MKRMFIFSAIALSFVYAKDYSKIYKDYCIKCHGSNGSKVVKRYKVNYKPINKLTKDEIIKALKTYRDGGVGYTAKTSRLMKKNLEKKGITSDTDITGVANFIVNKLGK